MKVAYVTSFYASDVDGRFGRFHDWIHRLRDVDAPPFDFEVIAFTADSPDETLASTPGGFLGNGDELWGDPKNKLEFLFNAPRVIRDLRQSDADVVHVLTLDAICYPIARFCRNRNVPLVVGPDVQGYFPGRLGSRWNRSGLAGLRNQLSYHFRSTLSSGGDNTAYITLSEYQCAFVRELTGFDTRVHVLSPGVDPIFSPSKKRASRGPIEFLYVGDISEYKGYPLFLEALSQLDFDFTATIIGAGEHDWERVKKLGIESRVTFGGHVSRCELPDYYRAADFFVMPSIDENGPNTVVEALATGTPVIVTDRPGINEYHPSDAGLVFRRSAEHLAETLREAYYRRNLLTKSAYRHAEKFHIDNTIGDLARLYRDILRG